MLNKTKIQVDYTTKTKYFQLFLPINFEMNIPTDDSVRLLSNVLEELDYTELYRAYSRKEKIMQCHRRIILKSLYMHICAIFIQQGKSKQPAKEILTLCIFWKEQKHLTITQSLVSGAQDLRVL